MLSNLSNLAQLRMQVFGTPHGPFQAHPGLPASPAGGLWGGQPPSAPLGGTVAAPVQGTVMPQQGALPNLNRLQMLQSLNPQGTMMRGPMSF